MRYIIYNMVYEIAPFFFSEGIYGQTIQFLNLLIQSI